MSRTALLAALLAWTGATLVLSEIRGFRPDRLVERVAPYLPGATARRRRPDGAGPVQSFRDVVAPLVSSAGDRASRALGVSEELARRLDRVHARESVATFRMRQLGDGLVALAGAALVSLWLRPPAPIALLFVVGAPALAFLAREQQLAGASARWQEQLALELPVVSEQLGMLLGAGYSLGSALNRIASRGSGACATDLRRVCGRIRQGLSVDDALHEWADGAGVPALDRLVAVVSLDREASDLGTLISEEARTMRRDAHRRLIASIERRAQLVWVPVTVATLVPGVVLLAVPFVQAMRLFTSG
jgi:Flp pilus assembly protein TadB